MVAIFPLSFALGAPFAKEDDYFSSRHGKEINIDGTIRNIKKHILSRSNYMTFDIVDADEYSVSVKLYTINWLKRVNEFDCRDGDIIQLVAAPFNYNKNQKKLGSLVISSKAKSLSCEREEKSDATNEN